MSEKENAHRQWSDVLQQPEMKTGDFDTRMIGIIRLMDYKLSRIFLHGCPAYVFDQLPGEAVETSVAIWKDIGEFLTVFKD